MGEIKTGSQRENKGQTLEEFLSGLAEKIDAQNKGTLAVGTMLTDLVDELGQLVKRLGEKAIICSEKAQKLLEEMRGAVEAQDHDRWDTSSQAVYELKGRIDTYMEVARELQELGTKVGGRPSETKH